MNTLSPTVNYSYFNLVERYQENNNYDYYKNKFNEFKASINGFTDKNEKFNLETGDVIKYISGYNSDIIYTSEILGFNEFGHAFVLWDCYWYPVNLEKNMVEKVR